MGIQTGQGKAKRVTQIDIKPHPPLDCHRHFVPSQRQRARCHLPALLDPKSFHWDGNPSVMVVCLSEESRCHRDDVGIQVGLVVSPLEKGALRGICTNRLSLRVATCIGTCNLVLCLSVLLFQPTHRGAHPLNIPCPREFPDCLKSLLSDVCTGI